jgi:hypothetical protein
MDAVNIKAPARPRPGFLPRLRFMHADSTGTTADSKTFAAGTKALHMMPSFAHGGWRIVEGKHFA